MIDDNQKFLNKFKDQISTMGKDGILGTDNNISSITNVNNTINSTFNNSNTKIIFKNSLSDKNTIKKGSAFLKPINKQKDNKNNIDIINHKNIINKNEQSKNNPKDENNNNNQIIQNNENKNNLMNNPYITNPQINQNRIIQNPQLLYYPYQNPYLYNNNINIPPPIYPRISIILLF